MSNGADGGKGAKSMTDNYFNRLENYITQSIQRFVAFMFILVSIGAVLGYFVAQRRESEIIVIIPALAGLAAYYNRDFAVAIFTFLILFIFLL